MARLEAERERAAPTLWSDVGYAFLSLLLGTVVWALVKQQSTREARLPIRVIEEGVPPYVEIALDPVTVTTRFDYPDADSPLVTEDRFSFSLDLGPKIASIAPGETLEGREALRIGDLDTSKEVPESVKAIEIVGNSRVRWTARLRSDSFAVEPIIRGEPAEGFTFDRRRIHIEPATVDVALTREAEQDLRRGNMRATVATRPIDITGKSDLVDMEVEIDFPPGLEPAPPQRLRKVRVAVMIEERIVDRTFEEVPLEYVPISRDLAATIDPPTVPVTVRGPQRLVNALREEDVSVSAVGVDERLFTPQQVAIRARVTDPRVSGAPLEVESPVRDALVTLQPAATPTPSPTPEPSPTPSPSATPEPSPTPSATPEPTPSPSTTPAPSPTGAPTATAAPTPQPPAGS